MNSRTIRHIAQQAAIIGMEASCFAAVVYLFGVGEGEVPILAFLLVGWLLLAFNRWLFGLAVWDTARGKLISILSGLTGISLLMGLASEEVGFLAGPLTFMSALRDVPRFFSGQAPLTAALLGGMVLYYRVLVTVREPVGVMGIARRVVSSMAALIWVIFLMEVQRGSVSWNVVMIFGTFTLLAFILSRTHELDMIPGVAPLPVTPLRTGIISGIIVLTLGAGFLIQAYSVEPLTRIGGLLQPLWSFFIILLAFPLRLLLMALDPLVQMLSDQFDLEAPPPPAAPVGTDGQADPLQVNPETWVVEWLYIIAGIGAVIVIYVIFAQAYRRFRHGVLSQFAPGTTNEASELGNWFPFRLRNPFARRGEYGLNTVRDLYKNVLVFGENQGVLRADDDTPYEYLEPLAAKYPSAQAEFQALTEAYVATHYGEVEFTREEISRLKSAWEKIKALPTI